MKELKQWVQENGPGHIEMPNTLDLPMVCMPCGSASDWKRCTTGTSVQETEDWRSEMNACSTCTIPVRSNNFGKGMKLAYFNVPGSLPCNVVAAIKGDVEGRSDVAVRIHSECFTGDVLRSAKCDCGLQLEKYFTVMEDEPAAVLLYVQGHEGRGIGLAAKMDAYRLQTEQNLDTVDSNRVLGFEDDLRSYEGIVQILVGMGIKSVRAFTNNRDKLRAIERALPMKHVPLRTAALPGNRQYLKTKEERMEHLSTMVEEGEEQLHWQERQDKLSAQEQPRVERIEWPRFGDYAGFRVALVSTAWNKECTSRLVEGCEQTLVAAKCHVSLLEVPGALDLVAGCRAVMDQAEPPHAIVALGTYVRGDTESSQMHYQATVSALQELNVTSSIPTICGVIFANNQEDAARRSDVALGGAWAKNALQMMSVSSVL